MQKYRILWADDEIDLLKPHILFLNEKGYEVTPVNSGSDAIDLFDQETFDIVFLDENMPGMSGLETLSHMKAVRPTVPVIMITKSEEEDLMEEAIGSKIADYLIKPLNPNQILMSVKKLLDNKRLVEEKTNLDYQHQFREIGMTLQDYLDHQDWVELYKKLVHWDLQFNTLENSTMSEVLETQRNEASTSFSEFIMEHYEDWLNDPDGEKPILSHQLMKKKVFPQLEDGVPIFFIVIDNLRLDQWKILEPVILEYFTLEEEDAYYSILPTTTAYARNAIFSGMMPSDMEKYHNDIWVGEDQEGGKNNHEDEFLARQIEKLRLDIRHSYHKIKQVGQGKQVNQNLNNLLNNDLNVLVYNFVDMLSHARTDMNMIRELAPDEPAYRSLTHSWFLHSPLWETLKRLSEKKCKVIITTDHGTIRVRKPFKIIGDRNVNTNLRYKQGKNLGFEDRNVFVGKKPEALFLPKPNVSTTYVFCIEDYFFAYPNNYNHYVKYYNDTFQHGGISMEEVIIPIISLNSKNG